MPKRTTLILEEDVYNALVQESVRRYGNARRLSKVVNEVLRRALTRRRERLTKLLYGEKAIRLDAKEFHRFRRELSRRLEST